MTSLIGIDSIAERKTLSILIRSFLQKPADLTSYGPGRKKTCLWGFANNKGADQPVHLHSLISAFDIRFLESIICKLATGEISIF